MSSFTNATKSASLSASNVSKSSSSWSGYLKRGSGYSYDSYLLYDGPDPVTDQEIFYDTSGQAIVYTNLTKH